MTAEALYAHLATGTTHVCRAWTVRRRDGTVFGFTDHDRPLTVDGVVCRADTGMSARALQQTTGLSVDNTEAYGALSSMAISEADLMAGRFDGAEVRSYLVDWQNSANVIEQFRGNIGEVTRAGGSFKAELRGLSDLLNRPHGMAYTPGCSAVLGDSRCRFDVTQPGYFSERVVEAVEEARLFAFGSFAGFDDRWFENGRLEMTSGAAKGLIGAIKSDRLDGVSRRIELWQSLGAEVVVGDGFRVIAGCDKSSTQCRSKFLNFLNFRGFPHIPGEDWLASYPVPDRPNGGARRSGGGGT